MLCQSTVSIGVHNFPYVFVLLRPTVPSKFRPHFNIPFRKHGAALPPFFFIFHLLRVSRCIFEFRNKKVPKKNPACQGKKQFGKNVFFFNFFRALKAILRIFWVESHLLKCFGSFPALMHTLSSLHFCHARSALSFFHLQKREHKKETTAPNVL